MQIRVVYHDTAKEIIGSTVEVLHLDDSATVASLLSRLGASHPGALNHLDRLQLARGGQSITTDAFLSDGDIIDVSMSKTATA